MNPPSKSLREVGLRAELNVPIIIVSVILMFLGIVIDTILIEYYGVNLFVAISIGALISIVGNLVLLYGQRNKLVKVFAVEIKDKITLKDEVRVIKRKANKTTTPKQENI